MAKKQKHVEPRPSISDEVMSTTECTGLVQTPPENDYQAANLSDLYNLKAGPQPDAFNQMGGYDGGADPMGSGPDEGTPIEDIMSATYDEEVSDPMASNGKHSVKT